jgi:hypothetical protein
MVHCYTNTSPLLPIKTQELELQITPNITHEESLPLTLKIFNSHDQIFPNYEPSTAVCYRELTRERASVSPINPWSDTRETLLPTVLQLLRHCWNAWPHCWRGHVNSPHSCVIQVLIAVAWKQTRRGDVRRCATRHGTAEFGSAQRKHRFVYCCVIAGTCFDVPILTWRKYATICLCFYRRIMIDVIALNELLFLSNDTSSIVCFLFCTFVWFSHKKQTNTVTLVRKQTIQTERPPLIGEISNHFYG